MKEVNILFTSVGRRVELVRAFQKAAENLAIAGRIIGTDIDALAPALHLVDTPILVPPYSSPDYVPRLTEICRRESVHLVFPLIDPDIEILAKNKEVLEKTGACVGVISASAAETTADKWATFRFFESISIPTPRSWLPHHVDPADITYPVVIKPRFGSASKNVFQVRNQREYNFFIDYVRDPIVQEFISGPEITSDVLCSLKGELLAVVSRRRVEVRWGEVSKGVTMSDPEIIKGSMKIVESLPAVGPITVQCILKESVPYFTEINARFAGGAPLALAAGVDFPRWYLAEAAGLSFAVPPVGTYRKDLYLTRFDESFFLSVADIEQISRNRV